MLFLEGTLVPINGISVISYGKNLSDIRTNGVTCSVRERIKLVRQGTTVVLYIQDVNYLHEGSLNGYFLCLCKLPRNMTLIVILTQTY